MTSDRAKAVLSDTINPNIISELAQVCAVGNIKRAFAASKEPMQPVEGLYLCNESLKLLLTTDKTKMLAVVKNITNRAFSNDLNRDGIDPQHFLTAYAKAALAGQTSMTFNVGDNSYPVPIRPAMAYSFAYAYATLNPKAEIAGAVTQQDAIDSLFGNIPAGGIKQSALAGAQQARKDGVRVSANDNVVVPPAMTLGVAPTPAAAISK